MKKPTVKILNATSETADIFGFIKNALKTAGTPIPINDVSPPTPSRQAQRFILFWATAVEAASVNYTYDGAGRLVGAAYEGTSITWAYDASGNVLSRTTGGAGGYALVYEERRSEFS